MAELSRSEQRFLDSYWNNRQYEGGRMYRCSFANARLSNIGLKKEIDIQSSVWFWSKLTNIRCSGLRMVVGHCEECTFWSVILDDTVMAGFRFVKSVILGCQFTDTTLSNLRLKKCEMVTSEAFQCDADRCGIRPVYIQRTGSGAYYL